MITDAPTRTTPAAPVPNPFVLRPSSLDTLVAHATTAAHAVVGMMDAWTAIYDAGDCTPRQITAAAYASHQPINDAITVLEHAKQVCRQALAAPLQALIAPVEIPGQATLRWVAPVATVTYAPKTVAAITSDLDATLDDVRPSLDTLHTLPAILTAAQQGAISAADAEALVTTINDLARGCRSAQEAARLLHNARTEGVRSGYPKIEACRPTPPADAAHG